jgi:hypothetical protein
VTALAALSGCAEDPSFYLRWQLATEENLDDPDELASAFDCSKHGVTRVRLRTFRTSDGAEWDNREYACYPQEFEKDDPVGGPELDPGEYEIIIEGLGRDGFPWPCDPDDEERACYAVAEANVTILEDPDKKPVIDDLVLLAPIECVDGIDNDGDGQTDQADPACLVEPEGPESDDNFETLLTLDLEFLGNPDIDCGQVGVSHVGLFMEGFELSPVPCASQIAPFSLPLDAQDYILEVVGLDGEEGDAVTVTKQLMVTGGAYTAETIEFGASDFLEPIVSSIQFDLGYVPFEDATTRRCVDTNFNSALVIDDVEFRVRDVDADAFLDAVALGMEGIATDAGNGWLSTPCPNSVLETAPLTWGRYELEARGLASGIPCFENTEPVLLEPAAPTQIEVPRILVEKTFTETCGGGDEIMVPAPPDGCTDCTVCEAGGCGGQYACNFEICQ